MTKLDPKLDWQMDDEELWQASQSPTAQAAPIPRGPQLPILALVAALAILLVNGGWLWLHSAPAQDKRDQHSSTASHPATPGDAPVAQSLTQTLEALDNPIHIDAIQRAGDHIMAQVTVRYSEKGSVRAYRETRFYAGSANGWQRVSPDPALLGEKKTLKIANFTIVYRAVDADAVYQAVPKLEERYAILRQDFGLPAADATSSYTMLNYTMLSYTIEVATERVQPLTNYNYFQGKMSVSSPILLSAPAEMTPATLLYQAMVYPLVRMTLVESIHQHTEAWKHRLVYHFRFVDGVALWEMWDAGGPLASGHDAVVRWLYENGQGKTARRPVPDNYDAICRTYRIWQWMPSYFSIPLTCSEKESKMLTVERYPVLASTWTEQNNGPANEAAPAQRPYSDSVTMESILEYIVAKYGRDKVPQLVKVLGEESGPQTLIPALFGVSRSDFEAAWQAYLAQHY